MYRMQAEEIVQRLKGWIPMQEHLSSEPQHPCKRLAWRHSPVTSRMQMGDLRGSLVRWPNQLGAPSSERDPVSNVRGNGAKEDIRRWSLAST